MGTQRVFLGIACLLSSCTSLFASTGADDDIGLNKIVVTPYRYEEEILNTAAGITIINRQQIEQSNAQSIPGILKSETGLAVRDWYGNGTKVSVDMRGFGERSPENTLVLVDGRRVNEIDLSGVDWTQIPLDRVEKIEVVRGGSGSVLYGDNATGGVINIITRTGVGKPTWHIDTQIGSYDFNKQRLSLDGAHNGATYFFSASRESTHGYRENSHARAGDFSSAFTWAVSPALNLRMSNGIHKSDYGLPGELSDAELETLSRRASKYGDDFAKETDAFIDGGGAYDFTDWARFDVGASLRRRDMDTYWRVFYGGFGSPVYKNRITTTGLTPKLIIKKPFSRKENTLICGLDYYRSDYASNNYDYADVIQSFSDINKISAGYYLQDELTVTRNMFLLGGYRYEKTRYEFDYNNAGGTDPLDTAVTPGKKAFNSGLVYKYSPDSSAFINVSRSFRFPNPEEYSITWPAHSVDTSLKPQTGRHYEIGFKHHISPRIKADLTVFRMNLKDELYYDYSSFSNKNYDKTRHEGVESGFEARLAAQATLFGSYTYTRAVFDGGVYNNKTIPLVPRHKASLGLRYRLMRQMELNLSGNYIGERYFINDQANVLSRLNGYVTLDTNIAYTFKDVTALLGINNLLNKRYSEYATCNTGTGKKVYYPSPERSVFIKMQYSF
ncbi:MAG TPA: TonB-dependent receptor [Candidatus Omnitrophota bacterium]|nr:TonB-dependent receptor [Candidatus Omnitrophota bacterium]